MNWITLPNLSDYKTTVALMARYVDEVIDSKKQDTILLLEHDHIITAGTSTDFHDILDTTIPIEYVGRGGRATYHGPGQRIIYPIIDLTKAPWNKDLKKYVKFLEQWIIHTLKHFDIDANGNDDNVGIWVKDEKIGSIGIRARKWVAYHGIAVNINTDLTKFDAIIPCGIKNVSMISLESLCKRMVDMAEFDEALIKSFTMQRKLVF